MKKKTQKDCDKLISIVSIKLNPKCLLCGQPAQVGHHFVHRSKSLILRYDFENVISLCNSCHFKLHFNEGYWSGKIVEIKGMKWFKKLDKMKNKVVRYFDYDAMHEKLTKLLTD